jgi:LmbE family N-acetylglucosaminyl deacetylase
MLELQLGDCASVLCLGAHPDDIEIGAGATLRRLCKARPGVRIDCVVFSGSEMRAAEARAGARAFLEGASYELAIHAFTDSHFPSELRAIKTAVNDLAARKRYDLVLTHHGDDAHQDHRVIAELTWNAFRDHLVLGYEIPKYDGDLGRPNLFVPVADADRKFKSDALLEHYASQREKHWFSRETFDALLRLRGLECRSPTGYAEAFHARKVVLRP